MKKTLSIFFLLSICLNSIAQLPEYGLHIQSYPLQKSEFTSIALEDGKPIEYQGRKSHPEL